MLTVGVDIAKATVEAATWQDGRAVHLRTFEQTVAGWAALRHAVAALQAPTEGKEQTDRSGTDREPVALVLEPTGGYELTFALWARQQSDWQDALLLARFGASAQPPLPVWQPLASAVSEL
jgi:transposase